MRIVIQRVLEGSVSVNGEKVSQIGKGIVCLVGLGEHDYPELLKFWGEKICKIKLWPNKSDKGWATSVVDNQYEVLLVSQFTLNCTLQGNKPDFRRSMEAEQARQMFTYFVDQVKQSYIPSKVHTGVFQHYMHVALTNDGPATITIDEDGKDNLEIQKMVRKNLHNKAIQQKKTNNQQHKHQNKQEEGEKKEEIKEEKKEEIKEEKKEDEQIDTQ